MTLTRKQSLILAFLLLPLIGGCGYKGPLVLPGEAPTNSSSDASQPENKPTPTDTQDNTTDEGS